MATDKSHLGIKKMPTTINIKRIMLEELRAFKSRPDIYASNLQLSGRAITLLRELCTEFARNLINQALTDVNLNSRLMFEHINKVMDKRLDIPFVDSILPKPRDMTLYSYKPRKIAKNNSEIKLLKNDMFKTFN